MSFQFEFNFYYSKIVGDFNVENELLVIIIIIIIIINIIISLYLASFVVNADAVI